MDNNILYIKIHIKPNITKGINNWRMKRFQNDYQYLITYCKLIEHYIISKYEKKKYF